LRVSTSADSAPSLGVLTQRLDRGLEIVAVWPGRAADRGGLSRDDILLAVDELSLATAELKDRLKIYPPGAEVPFSVERHGRQERISVILDPPIPYEYSIEALPAATAQQLSIRNGWLGPER
jgi:predicted metalloprotease with PDZ domain